MAVSSERVRTFDLFSQVLCCVSRGQLAPPAIDDTLREFASARGSEYMTRLTGIAEDFVSGLTAAVGARSDETLAAPPPELFARLTHLYFELLTRFTDLQTTHIDDCLRALLNAADDDAASGVLALVAPLGDTASSSLIVENSGTEPLVVGCLATAVRRADGVGPAFAPSIAMTPLEQTLGPGEEGHVRTSLRLDAAVYQPDVLYVGSLRVLRQNTVHLEVPLHITATGARP